jgi:putative endonuclease
MAERKSIGQARIRSSRGAAAFRRGHGVERRAIWWLRLKGYRILAVNWRSAVGEVDLIARRGGCLAIIEVKQRSDHAAAAFALRPAQLRRLVRAASLFVAQRPEFGHLAIRFDLISFGRRGWPAHVKDAWRPESD